MPCNHKFKSDLMIEYANWEIRTLFIGTFNPCWESKNNYSNWFYGRTSNNEFWCILPKMYKNKSLLKEGKDKWIEFCKNNELAITDILTSLDDANVTDSNHQKSINGFKDEELSKFSNTKTDIGLILEKHQNIKQICITRQTLPPFWKDCFKDTLNWIEKHPERNISIIYLRSPSRGARKGVVGNFCDFVANKWIQQGYQIL